ncbi:Arc family DNA-binding protein [Stenotrophomonas maltophilia]|uniref:Arc family DNA-binding protein n=1 Tax=Stenotrophomonas maltophilia TaxID=40324 RepID=UPI001FA6CB43|nr:Arc family DNA-binding protein [Stenotrophomonas maltophilia]
MSRVPTQFRAPSELMDALRAAARSNQRSVNAEMIARLVSTFEGLAMPATDAGDGKAHFKIRLDDSLLAALKQLAADNNRSVTAQIEFILAAFVEDHMPVADQAKSAGSTCPTPEASR